MKHKVYYTSLSAKIGGWFFTILGIAIVVVAIATGLPIFLIFAGVSLLIGIPVLIIGYKVPDAPVIPKVGLTESEKQYLKTTLHIEPKETNNKSENNAGNTVENKQDNNSNTKKLKDIGYLFFETQNSFVNAIEKMPNAEQFIDNIDIATEFSALILVITDIVCIKNKSNRLQVFKFINDIIDKIYVIDPDNLDRRIMFYSSFINGKKARAEFGNYQPVNSLSNAIYAFADILYNHELLNDYDKAPIFIHPIDIAIQFDIHFTTVLEAVFDSYIKSLDNLLKNNPE